MPILRVDQEFFRVFIVICRVFREQLDRWHRTDLTTHEREEIDRLFAQLERLRKVLTNILALADELKEGTIDKILAKSDLELGIEVLLRGKL
jgi:hypothetical protein